MGKTLGAFFESERKLAIKIDDFPYYARNRPQRGRKTDAGDSRKLVMANDFVINSRSDRKASGISSLDGSVSLIRYCNDPEGKYLPYSASFVKDFSFRELVTAKALSRILVRIFEMKNILLPALSIEQQKIANFLDHETAKIDTLIAKQQELIKLLKEKRQAVISHAVTKGLNPNAPMRDSGVEWLGEVPAHWEISQPNTLCFCRWRNTVEGQSSILGWRHSVGFT
jgi:type I restriction enzyme S subunit